MKRRQFFSALAAVPVAARAATQVNVTQPVIPAPGRPADGITHLGTPIASALDRFIDQLSRNKLWRTAEEAGRQWTVRDVAGPGDRGLDIQLARGYRIQSQYLTDLGEYFELGHFEFETNGWVRGATLMYGRMDDGAHPARVYGAYRQCGMLHLPQGLPFAAHYIHEPSGLVMRAVADEDLAYDTLTIRWDLLLG